MPHLVLTINCASLEIHTFSCFFFLFTDEINRYFISIILKKPEVVRLQICALMKGKITSK